MGSYVQTKSTAIDNRLAVTDQALGVSSSGSRNNMALGGHVFNLSSSAGASGIGGSNKGGIAGDVNLSILDGGAIEKSFDFAAFSLSSMLENIINQGQQQQETAIYTVDTIGNAIQQASQISAATAAAVAATDEELNQKNQDFIKKAAVVAVAGALAWWVWKGKK